MADYYESRLPADFVKRIMRRVGRARRKALLIKAGVFGSLFLISLGLVVVAFGYLFAAIHESGMIQFADLFISDFSVAVANLQDMLYSLAESLPILQSAFFVGALTLLVWSAGRCISDMIKVRRLYLFGV